METPRRSGTAAANEAAAKTTATNADRTTMDSGNRAQNVSRTKPNSREAVEEEEVGVKTRQGGDQDL